jgi:subtilisin family serine protease
MMQIVHDLAPGAELAFATAAGGILSFADNVRRLRDEAGADIIVDDIGFLDQPFFQAGPISVAVSEVVAEGATYFSAVGNEAFYIGTNNVGSYQTPAYRPAPCPALFLDGQSYADVADCHDFDPGSEIDIAQTMVLDQGGSLGINMQWAEPWYGATSDLDLFVVDTEGNILARSINDNASENGSGEPHEFTFYTNTSGAPQTINVVFARFSGTTNPALKYILLDPDGLEDVQYNASNGTDTVGPTIWGHPGHPEAIGVAAVPYYDSTTPEEYTSWGPTTYYYAPVEGNTPAAPLPQPQVNQKPDIAATDGGINTFFGTPTLGDDGFRFFGTSGAAPHAAGVAALLLEADTTRTPAQIRELLTSTATDIIPTGYDNITGFGLINAFAPLMEQFGDPFDFAMSPLTSQIAGAPGLTVTHQVQLQNTGSAGDSYNLQATVVDGQSWSVRFSRNKIDSLQPGESVTVTVEVMIPDGAHIGDFQSTEITAISQGSEELQASMLLVTVIYDLQIDDTSKIASETGGSPVEYSLDITNTGVSTETFALTITESIWTTVFTGTDMLTSTTTFSVTLGAGESQQVLIAVEVPDNAGIGDSDEAVVEVMVMSSPEAVERLRLTTIAALAKVYLPFTQT